MRSHRAWRGLWVLAASAPWTWFLVRDLEARLDLVAIAWPVLGAAGTLALAVIAGLARRWEPGVAAGSWLVAAAVVVVAPWTPTDGPAPAPATDLRVVAANVLLRNGADVVDDLIRQEPELLVVSELKDPLDERLRRRFRHAERSPALSHTYRDVGVYSRFPLRQTPLPVPLRTQRGLRAVVDAPGGEVILYALHLGKPSLKPDDRTEFGFRSHRRLVEALRDAVAGEDRPVLVTGDLNLVDRTTGYRALTRDLDDAVRSAWVGPTSVQRRTRPLLARVDHVLVDPQWCATGGGTFGVAGSDHRGVAATVGPCP